MTILTTARLRLEPITDSHLEGLCRLNSDLEVMRYISGKAETREETLNMIDRVKARWVECGFSWWSFIDIDTEELIGAGCIQYLGRDPKIHSKLVGACAKTSGDKVTQAKPPEKWLHLPLTT